MLGIVSPVELNCCFYLTNLINTVYTIPSTYVHHVNLYSMQNLTEASKTQANMNLLFMHEFHYDSHLISFHPYACIPKLSRGKAQNLSEGRSGLRCSLGDSRVHAKQTPPAIYRQLLAWQPHFVCLSHKLFLLFA